MAAKFKNSRFARRVRKCPLIFIYSSRLFRFVCGYLSNPIVPRRRAQHTTTNKHKRKQQEERKKERKRRGRNQRKSERKWNAHKNHRRYLFRMQKTQRLNTPFDFSERARALVWSTRPPSRKGAQKHRTFEWTVNFEMERFEPSLVLFWTGEWQKNS